MKKNVAKLLRSMFLVFSAVLVLVGCAGSEEGADPSTEDTTTTETTEVEETSEAETEEGTEDEAMTGDQDLEGRTLNVVATSEQYVPMFEAFTEQTGAEVEFLSMSSGEVLSRMEAEGEASADLWFGGGLDAFMDAKEKGLLQNYESPHAEDVPEEYKDADGAWIAKGLTVVGFLGNNEVLEELGLDMPATWDELADPQYQGEVLMSNPAISGTNYAAVKGILDMKGEEEGWAYWEELNQNIPFYTKRGGDPRDRTAQGEFALGIIPVDKISFDLAEDNNLTVVYPEDGIPWVPEGVAIFDGAENADVAEAFIDFMLTPEGQEFIVEADGKDTAQLVKPDAEGYDLGLPEEDLVDQDLSTFGTMREEILDRFGEISSGKEEE